MDWSNILEASIGIITAGLVVYVVQLFLPDDHKKKIQRILRNILRYLW